eukprot:XP_014011514.1 PREDICTED: uncharacterized protein LOC106577713 [Salmo salar]
MSVSEERLSSRHASSVWTSSRIPLLNSVRTAGSFHQLDVANVWKINDYDALNYTALKFTDKKGTKPRRQRREQREEETIYSGMSHQDKIVSWYKQTVGQKPLLMASSYYGTENSFYFNNFTEDFTETKRLNVKRGFDSFNLTISKTESGDSATYYCVNSGNNCMSVHQQPVSESAKAGDSVTLNCTIHTETRAGEHSVYWFRHGSGESHPGIIYTHGDRSDQCEKSPKAESPTQSCVYNLPKRNLSLSDAGTYYCAVASCGEILFGNGTKLDVEAGTPFQQSHYGNPHANTSDQQLHGDYDALNYTALKFSDKKSIKPRRQRREQREEETIYSGVSHQDRM